MSETEGTGGAKSVRGKEWGNERVVKKQYKKEEGKEWGNERAIEWGRSSKRKKETNGEISEWQEQ